MSAESRQSDAELLESVRTGKAAAYGILYQRHVSAARCLARQLVSSHAEAEDAVAETFAKILDLVRRGGGPEIALRPYLLTALRRTIYDRARGESRQVPTDDLDSHDPGVPFVDPALAGLERSLVARAFMSLPDRWRMVLWHTEVESARAADLAPMLGLTPNAVAALAYRAREGLRQAYLQMHLSDIPRQGCRPVVAKMGAYVRGGLPKRESRIVDDHVAGCADCHAIFIELNDVNEGMRLVVGPLVAGPVLLGYLTALSKGGGAAAGGGLGALFGRMRRVPRRHRLAVAGAATTAAVAVLAFHLAPTAPVAAPAPSQAAPIISHERPAMRPTPRPEPKPTPQPVPVPAPAEPPPAAKGRARLVASIEPLGALVPSHPGIVGMRLRNEGRRPSGELAATVELPAGVTLQPAGRGGPRAMGAGLIAPVGTVDGWSCRPAAGGARCTRGPLPAGRMTAVFMRVNVAPEAPAGMPPTVRVAAGNQSVAARGASGVSTSGVAARFATDGRVSAKAIGNTLLSCPEKTRGCADARRGKGERTDNDLWEMEPVDADDDKSTKSSSAARLTLPPGGEIVWAGLYWSGGGKARASGTGIRLKPPGAKRYETIRATDVIDRELPAGHGYHAFADVTRLVGEKADGEWWAADARLRPGVSRHGGWSLAVVATDPRRPYSQVVVLDTATVVDGRERLRMPLAGLTPAAAPARIDLVTWEGDAGLAGEKVTAGEATLRPEGGLRQASNGFDGSANGALGWKNTFGVDIDTYRPTLGAKPVLHLSTGKDVVLFGVAVVSVHARS
ncbi:sigma-70 family RNA polymerase sigma factor [Spongiactinospora sp. TRM90649]|uniref:sigma factor n=1 Tax=Spongiactinospora sp. TRM90649 TaxID=3031114 RepID=UPI0023F89ACD|nr:sigma-70 family RNA polymerase sigma factor [Spongiactinospora sp. TRM90649]MDF5757483.1 sigma-70 family RNA polymerase sigma factor [Spongiactinospora sp. TRM90649]